MLLIFDIGNTNVKVALFESDKLLQQWRITTDKNRTGDEYFAIINVLFKDYNLDIKQISNVVVSSVVPQLIGAFVIVTQRFLNKEPLIICPDIYHKLPVTIPPTAVHEIGTDLLCDAVEAWETYHQPCIVVDFGTALSFVAVGNKGNILAQVSHPKLRFSCCTTTWGFLRRTLCPTNFSFLERMMFKTECVVNLNSLLTRTTTLT